MSLRSFTLPPEAVKFMNPPTAATMPATVDRIIPLPRPTSPPSASIVSLPSIGLKTQPDHEQDGSEDGGSHDEQRPRQLIRIEPAEHEEHGDDGDSR